MPNKILIVDDEPFNLDLLEQELMEYDYIIERATDGVDALAKADSFSPDIILLDYMMPKMNGLEVVRRHGRASAIRAMPVILLTAKATQEDKVAGLDAGADDYVTKPFDSFELLARVRAMLRIKELHDQLGEWNRTLAEKVTATSRRAEAHGAFETLPLAADRRDHLGEEENLFKTSSPRDHRRVPRPARLHCVLGQCRARGVMDLLRDYHAEMGKLIFKFEGTLERFVGDGIVVIFNDPLPCEDHGQSRQHGDRDARSGKELRIAWTKKGYDLDLGVGLATGYATLGTIGFEGRMDYSSVGNLPNLAARMCAEAKGGQILTDQKTMSRLEEFFDSEAFEEFQLKGLSRPVRVFNILAAKA